jgi:hypothetical protein
VSKPSVPKLYRVIVKEGREAPAKREALFLNKLTPGLFDKFY